MRNIVYGNENLGIAILLEDNKSFHLSLYPIQLSMMNPMPLYPILR